MQKKCSKCGAVLPLTEYHKNPKTKDGYCGACKACRSAQAREWYEANKEQQAKRSAKRRMENPEKRRDTLRRSNAKRAEIVSQWQKDNPDRVRERNERWRKANKGKVVSRMQRYRTKKTGTGGSFTHQEWIELCAKYKGRCACCGEQKPLEADHVVPVSAGGGSDISNIQPLCRSCNARKNNRIEDYR